MSRTQKDWFTVFSLAIVLLGCERPDAEEPERPLTNDVSGETTAPIPKENSHMLLDTETENLEVMGREVAILAGGCFWGMEEILREVDGVLDTEVGYAGGNTDSPTYEHVKTGGTGHAESVRIVFDPAKVSFAELLEQWFFRMHDPTTENRQGNDVGTQYRSAIFFTTPEQEQLAREVVAKVDASGVWDHPIVTEIAPAGTFTPAESYHQDYLQQNPRGYTCHYLRDF